MPSAPVDVSFGLTASQQIEWGARVEGYEITMSRHPIYQYTYTPDLNRRTLQEMVYYEIKLAEVSMLLEETENQAYARDRDRIDRALMGRRKLLGLDAAFVIRNSKQQGEIGEEEFQDGFSAAMKLNEGRDAEAEVLLNRAIKEDDAAATT